MKQKENQMKKAILLAVYLTFSIAAFGQTNSTNGDFLKRFIGTWKGEGKITGLDSKIVMTWENVLDGKFVKLSFRNEMKKKDGGTQIFEGIAFYKAKDAHKYQGNWFDSGGEALPIEAQVVGNALTSTWGTEGAKLGQTNYRLMDEQKMEVVDSVKLPNGTWYVFGRAVYFKSNL